MRAVNWKGSCLLPLILLHTLHWVLVAPAAFGGWDDEPLNLGLRVDPFARSKKALLGNSTTMACRGWSRDGSGNITVDWYFEDKKFTLEHPLAGTTLTWAEKKVDITSFTTLTIHKVGLEHGGQYKCVVRTLDGRKELADHMFLHVVVPPTIKAFRGGAEKVNILVSPGDTLRVDCEVTAFPAAAVHWLYNGRPLPAKEGRVKTIQQPIKHDHTGKLRISGSTLVVLGFNEPDNGIYRCICENEAANNSRALYAFMLAKPVIVSLETIYAHPGQNITLTNFRVYGAPPLDLAAERRNHRDLDTDPPRNHIKFGLTGRHRFIVRQEGVDVTQLRLDLDNVVPADSGHYSFSVHNKAGRATLEIRLFVLRRKHGRR